MLARDYLNLNRIHLEDGSDWTPSESCLTFVFPSSGTGYVPACPGTAPHNGDGGQCPGASTTAARPSVRCPVSSGRGTRLAAGDVLVLRAGQGKICSYAGNGGFEFSTFALCIEQLFPLFGGRDVALLDTVREAFQAPKHYPAWTPVAGQCHKLLEDVPPQFDLDHRSQLLRAASAVLVVEFKNARERPRAFCGVEEHMSDVLDKLSAEEVLCTSVVELASRCGCTARHLNRLFHQRFSCSVVGFKMEMRLLKAASLLCDPQAKVIDVAARCRFNFIGYFNQCFKRRFGASPTEWRAAHAPGVDGVPVSEPSLRCPMRQRGLCPWCAKDGAAVRHCMVAGGQG